MLTVNCVNHVNPLFITKWPACLGIMFSPIKYLLKKKTRYFSGSFKISVVFPYNENNL